MLRIEFLKQMFGWVLFELLSLNGNRSIHILIVEVVISEAGDHRSFHLAEDNLGKKVHLALYSHQLE